LRSKYFLTFIVSYFDSSTYSTNFIEKLITDKTYLVAHSSHSRLYFVISSRGLSQQNSE